MQSYSGNLVNTTGGNIQPASLYYFSTAARQTGAAPENGTHGTRQSLLMCLRGWPFAKRFATVLNQLYLKQPSPSCCSSLLQEGQSGTDFLEGLSRFLFLWQSLIEVVIILTRHIYICRYIIHDLSSRVLLLD